MNSDRIERQIHLRAPRSRVWQALIDAREFGTWFGVNLESAFAAGRQTRGKITIAGYEHVTFEVAVERMQPEQSFSFRWHPYAIDPKLDYSKEPTTLVEFRLEEVPDGTLLTVTESGFDAIPAERRAEAFRMNTQGWEAQLQNILRHVSG